MGCSLWVYLPGGRLILPFYISACWNKIVLVKIGFKPFAHGSNNLSDPRAIGLGCFKVIDYGNAIGFKLATVSPICLRSSSGMGIRPFSER